jgi:hypothetical protein
MDGGSSCRGRAAFHTNDDKDWLFRIDGPVPCGKEWQFLRSVGPFPLDDPTGVHVQEVDGAVAAHDCSGEHATVVGGNEFLRVEDGQPRLADCCGSKES